MAERSVGGRPTCRMIQRQAVVHDVVMTKAKGVETKGGDAIIPVNKRSIITRHQLIKTLTRILTVLSFTGTLNYSLVMLMSTIFLMSLHMLLHFPELIVLELLARQNLAPSNHLTMKNEI